MDRASWSNVFAEGLDLVSQIHEHLEFSSRIFLSLSLSYPFMMSNGPARIFFASTTGNTPMEVVLLLQRDRKVMEKAWEKERARMKLKRSFYFLFCFSILTPLMSTRLSFPTLVEVYNIVYVLTPLSPLHHNPSLVPQSLVPSA